MIISEQKMLDPDSDHDETFLDLPQLEHCEDITDDNDDDGEVEEIPQGLPPILNSSPQFIGQIAPAAAPPEEISLEDSGACSQIKVCFSTDQSKTLKCEWNFCF